MTTFIIGNGFDLALNLKTKYADVYNGYIKEPSSDRVIERFKQDLKANDTNWTDFEMAMAKYACTFLYEDDFIKCIRDFKVYLAQYLRKIEKDFITQLESPKAKQLAYLKRFGNNISSFSRRLTPNIISEIAEVQGNELNFITFNYTGVFDYFVEGWKQYYINNDDRIFINSPLHIHGTINNEIITGIDNLGQFERLSFTPSSKLQRAFLKPYFISSYDKKRLNTAYDIFKRSSVICAFGFSFGQSDSSWLNITKKWLLSDDTHHLVLDYYDKQTYDLCNQDLVMDVEDMRKDLFLEKFSFSQAEREKVWSQIHIPIGEGIFSFKNVSYEERPLENGLRHI